MEPDIVSLEEYLCHLKTKHERFLKLEKYLSRGNSLSKEEEMAYYEEFNTILNLISSDLNMWQGCPSTSKTMHKVEHQDKKRYLCVSDGFTICCLDLKPGTDDGSSHLQQVPSKISTLELLQERLSFSFGLLNIGSNAYMVGGQEFPSVEDSDLLNLKDQFSSDFDMYCSLHNKYVSQGDASCTKTYGLTLDQGSLRLSQCSDIKSTNRPKFWPLVEQIDDHLHIIEYLPSGCCKEIQHPGNYDPAPSHEVLARDRWLEVQPPPLSEFGNSVYIQEYLVVGHRLYATGGVCCIRFLVFDAHTLKWESHMLPEDFKTSMLHIKHVIENFQFGFGRCIGKYEFRDSPNLYVVLAIGNEIKIEGMLAVAYLVTTSGQILCYQRLNLFFEGFKEPVKGRRPQGTIISSGSGSGGGQGNEMCVVFRASRGKDSLYITTFTWEVVDGASALVSDLRAQIRDEEEDLDKLPFPDEEDFIKVTVKGWYASHFGTGLKLGSDAKPIPPRLSACFL